VARLSGTARTSEHENRRAHTRYTFILEGSAERLTPIPAGPLKIVTSNISLGGMMLHTNLGIFVSPRDILKLTFVDFVSQIRVNFQACIVWKKRDKGSMNPLGEYALGVAFCDTPEQEIRKLHDTVTSRWAGLSDGE